jgi:hypothetical protein
MDISNAALAQAILAAAIEENQAIRLALPRNRSQTINASIRITAAQNRSRFELALIDRIKADANSAGRRKRDLQAEQQRRAKAGIPPVELQIDEAASLELQRVLRVGSDEAMVELQAMLEGAALPTPSNDID